MNLKLWIGIKKYDSKWVDASNLEPLQDVFFNWAEGQPKAGDCAVADHTQKQVPSDQS